LVKFLGKLEAATTPLVIDNLQIHSILPTASTRGSAVGVAFRKLLHGTTGAWGDGPRAANVPHPPGNQFGFLVAKDNGNLVGYFA
jgi:hypothetical protein